MILSGTLVRSAYIQTRAAGPALHVRNQTSHFLAAVSQQFPSDFAAVSQQFVSILEQVFEIARYEPVFGVCLPIDLTWREA